MKRILLLFTLMVCAITTQAQLKGKIKDILASDVFFKQLKETQEKVQGDAGVPNFLEKTMQHPDRISLTDFRKEKQQYYALCTEYNQIVDDIISMVKGFESIKELKEISLVEYKSRIASITTKFHDFFTGLNRYHKDALVLDLLIDVFKFAKPLITQLINEGKETIKRIIAEELKSLKITPIAWEATEAIVASGQSVGSPEEITAKIGIAKTDHFRSLNLNPTAMTPEINAAYAQLKEEYSNEISGSSNPDIKDFFTQLLDRVESAKKYFDANPPKAPAPIAESKAPAKEFNNAAPSDGGSAALKSELEGLLRGAKYMTKEQLLEELDAVLKKY